MLRTRTLNRVDGTYYEILGVRPDEDTPVIRKAYVKLAWSYHPDRNSGVNEAEATRRMRALNEAWATVSDPDLRREYDRRIAISSKMHTGGSATGDNRTARDWVPFDTSEPTDIDFDDTPTGTKPLPRFITLAPAAMLALAVVFGFFASLVKSSPMFVIAIVIGVVAVSGFLLVPLLAMSRAERDPNL